MNQVCVPTTADQFNLQKYAQDLTRFNLNFPLSDWQCNPFFFVYSAILQRRIDLSQFNIFSLPIVSLKT